MGWLRAPLVFLAAFACLAAIAGKSLQAPSADNHYSYMAQGWLEGRLSLEGRPPHGNDFGKVVTLELRDGRELRAFPCRTRECKQRRRSDLIETWWLFEQRDWYQIPYSDILRRTPTWYVTFPPGPAALMLPFVAIWGLGFLDVLFTVMAAALIPVVIVRFLDREHGLSRDHLWVAAAWTVASPACFVAANGSVWFTAQILGALFLWLYVAAAWDVRAPGRAGLWLALGTACRVPVLLAAPLFLFEWWRGGRSRAALIRFALPLVVVGAAMMWLNWARFGNPLEFGHRYLDIRWTERIQQTGLFSVDYLWRNIQAAFFLLPRPEDAPPFLKFSIHGSSLVLTTPWLVALLVARQRFPQRAVVWACVVAIAIPALLYQNTGQMQFTYRFALDYLPLLVVALVLGGGARTRWFRALVCIAALIQVYGAWMFAHRKGQLFVASLWPFES